MSMGTPAGGFAAAGAVDLAALAQAREAQARAREAARRGDTGGGDGAASAVIREVSEASFQSEVVDLSHSVPVVIDFWASWCEPCKQLGPVLERLVAAGAGRWVLAKVDVDANQRLAQAFGVQSIPAVFAVVAGQPLPLFQGALPESQVADAIAQLLDAAAQAGVVGSVAMGAAEGDSVDAAAPEPIDPELDVAAEAIDRGDLLAAQSAYRTLLQRHPTHVDARAGLALVTLLQRTEGMDAETVLALATNAPDDIDAQCRAADVLMVAARVDEAFDLLVAAVARSGGDDRQRAREHLVELFEMVGADHPSVVAGRRALANALY